MFKLSLFSEPKDLKTADVGFSALVVLAFCILAPERLFLRTNIDWSLYLSILIAGPIMGAISAALANKKNPGEPDPFYIRAWWGFLSGMISFPLCLLFRRTALDFSAILILISFGEIAGNVFYRKIHFR